VIAVGYSSPDPTLARDVPNVTVARFLAMRRRGRQGEASSTAAALREQIRTLSQELATSDATLRRFRERGRVVDPKQEGSTQIARLAALRTDRTRLGAERDALAALMAALAARAGGERGAELPYRQIGGFPGLRDNEAVGSYVRALTAVEEQRAALLVRRTPEDPDVVALTDRARTLEQQLRGTAAAYLDGITRQTAAMDAELARTEQQLARLPGQEAEYARLERGPKVLGEMLTLLQTRLKEAEIAEAVQDPTVQLLDAAPLPKRAVRPRPSRDVPLAAFGGLLLGLAGVLVRERLDRTVRTRDDVQAWARLPVLGVIPRGGSGRGAPPMLVGGAAGGRRSLPGGGGRGRRDAIDPMLLEAFARLQARVAFAHAGERPRTVVITSPLSGEGKTSTAGNLARAVAHTGSHTLLIDADLPRGTLHKRFGLARAPGMAELLAGAAAFDDVVHRVDVGGGVTLAVIPAGEPVGPERRLLTSERVGEVLALAAARFDSVLVDAPPLNLTADATVLAGAADAVLLVARAGQTPLDALAHAAQHLEGTRATTLGVVVNDVDPVRDAAYDAEYRYYADPYLHTGEAR
jgi:capsular exopolysaccharide synthesis family protein